MFLWMFFGTPHVINHSVNDTSIVTRGGFVTVHVWSDYYVYGAMLLQDKQTDNGGSQVVWWLRWEWFKHK
jgi:hypothetical protein